MTAPRNLDARLAAMAAPYLWGVQLVGIGKVVAMHDWPEALSWAARHNAGLIDLMEQCGQPCLAVPCLWPRSAQDHAAGLVDIRPDVRPAQAYPFAARS